MISYTKQFGLLYVTVSPYGVTLSAGLGGGFLMSLLSVPFPKPAKKQGQILYVDAEPQVLETPVSVGTDLKSL